MRGLLSLLCLVSLTLGVMAAADEALESYAVAHFGTPAGARVRAWRDTLAQTRGRPEVEQLRAVNDFFNRHLRFADDPEIWGQADYWATPIESLGKAAGDCEDYAIAKYFSLRELDVDPRKLRLIYVRARIGGPTSSIVQAHMVLGYYASPEAEPLVLDNLIGDIRPATSRPDLQPVFSFNSEGVYAGAAVSSVERLSRWKDLQLRMRQEGYTPH